MKKMLRGPEGPNASRVGGFSLIEMLIALTLSVIVVAVSTAMLAMSVRDGKRETARAEMAREGGFAQQLLSYELGASGTGVPDSPGIVAGMGTIYGGVLIAEQTAVGVVADIPRPGTNFNSAGPIAGRAAASDTAVAWTTANSGACMPGPDCATGTTSIFFPGETGCTGTATDRTCPWGMNRVMPGDWLVIAAGDGSWTYGQASTPALAMSEVNGSGNGWFFSLENAYNGGATLWPYDYVGPPLSTRGLGVVSTPDRIFYRHQGTELQRLQCWGKALPNDADWPPGNVNALGSFTPVNVGAAGETDCTPWEPILRNVTSLSFRYYQQNGAEILPAAVTSATLKAGITRVDWAITVMRTVMGQDVFHQLVGAADVRH